MPSLIEANLDVELPDIRSLMGSITSVKLLSICSEAMLDEGFVFNQLEHLELCTCKELLPNQLVRLLNASPNLEGLILFYMDSINMWVAIAVSHCLRELDIGYASYPDKSNILPMPSNLFTCKSLVILKLAGGILLDVPRMVSLPSLKTLRLHKVKFLKDETLQRLLSNCPILEDLLVDLRDDTMRKFTVVVPSLQRLTLRIPDNPHIDGFIIETPSLKHFKLRLHCIFYHHYFLVENMPNLIEAHIDVELHKVQSLIGSITSVKRLALCSQIWPHGSFVFNQLEHLELCTCPRIFPNQIVRLLKASSKLKRLGISLMNVNRHRPQVMVDWNQPITVPECLLSSLQSLGWSKYKGKPQERHIVVYILEHALHLKTATIKSSELEVPKYEMLKELSLSSRASAACRLMVRYFNDKALQRLLSHCPVLEDLLVDLGERDRYSTRKLSVVVPSLLSLSLVIPDDHEIDELVIDTPALKCFKLVDHSSSDHYCLIENMPYLIKAHIDIELLDITSVVGSITSVKWLAICSEVTLDEGFVFNQLEHLELCLCQKHSSNQLVRLLKASPNLEGLNLFYMDDHESLQMDDWNQPTSVPECILSSLQSFSWSEYTGEPHEREIAVYILKHALHLKTATIKSSQWDVTELEMLKELSRSSRASTACQLIAPVIESFRLDLCCSRFKPENIRMWVVKAVSHCLRELEIVYESDTAKPIVLPSNLYTCKSLVVLKLRGGIFLDVPRMVSLPSLKTLKLISVIYLKDETLQRLLSNCPILEDLLVELGERDTTRKLTIVVPSLQRLSLDLAYDHYHIDGFMLLTPALKYFKLWDHNCDAHYCLIESTMPFLVEAHLDVEIHELNSLIGSLTSVKRLSICSQEHESSGMDDWNEPTTVPECILSSLQSFSWSKYTGEPHERDVVVYILKHARHLKTATIKSSQSDVPKLEMLKELALSSRASTTCQLNMDRISGLSDELLLKILLLVPTKVAVSTSILSKRWRYLWMWLPRLEFRYKRLLDPECERLQSFLDRNLRYIELPL
ncbi:hypothetical protein Bca101_021305 [Brassica carinata]